MPGAGDAVFAIAITLPTLQLSVLKGLSEQVLSRALSDDWPSYFSFVLSFGASGSNWSAHHQRRQTGWRKAG